MRNIQIQKNVLRILSVITLGVLFLLLRKRPTKDWVVAYLFNAVSNGIIDKMVVKHKLVKYPVRLFPQFFNIHILFDFLIYPTITVMYNQITYKNKPLAIIGKIFLFTIPMLIIEFWAEKQTDLIEWKKGWGWSHTLIGLTIMSLLARLFVGLVRYVSEGRKRERNV
ncbi:CBO0543 family protein [Halalkalibacter kiskunsagensis]|uniref:CBO0543 family protein n=1 Tax=Halalkalibacter kiskunsagensis TaxID=1548599 RepID=A0ABV6KEK2_9BACI